MILWEYIEDLKVRNAGEYYTKAVTIMVDMVNPVGKRF